MKAKIRSANRAVKVANPRFIIKAINELGSRAQAAIERYVEAEMSRMTGFKPIRRPTRKKATRRRPARARRTRGGQP